ncbi:MAG: hypothetical protein K2L00_01580 [Muribaculaceae bacterium]|nr:hypothetical protein [Muribaculaceae bacterium]
MAKINVDQFAILADKAPYEGVSYSIGFGFNVAANASRIACVFTIDFSFGEKPILKLSITCEFDIHEEDWNNLIKDDTLSISKEDLGFFANQTVGAARGILFCKTENSDFRDYILPPINLNDILDKDLEINLSKDN